LCNPHLQTVLASRLAVPPRPPVLLERLELDDGDFVDLAHGGALVATPEDTSDTRPADTSDRSPENAPAVAAADDPASRLAESDRDAAVAPRRGVPMVALFHGLAGSLDSSYARGAIAALGTAGFRTCLMHWRGCSGEPNRLARSYHSGASDDIGRIVDTLRARHPDSALYAVGFSLGGNALLKYLGEQGEATPLAGALAVSPPLELAIGAEQLDRGLARVYRGHLLALMRAQHEAKRALRPALALPQAHAGLDTFRKFDDALTAPLHGFAGVDDYYERCSARGWLGTIRRPTHILCARDDPFFTEEILPGADELAAATTLELARHGGHVGFLAGGRAGRPYRWLDEHVAQVIARFHEADT